MLRLQLLRPSAQECARRYYCGREKFLQTTLTDPVISAVNGHERAWTTSKINGKYYRDSWSCHAFQFPVFIQLERTTSRKPVQVQIDHGGNKKGDYLREQ